MGAKATVGNEYKDQTEFDKFFATAFINMIKIEMEKQITKNTNH